VSGSKSGPASGLVLYSRAAQSSSARIIREYSTSFGMATRLMDRRLRPGIESIYVIASPHYSFLSSTGVKEMATFGGDVGDLVPPAVASALAERLADR